MPLTIPNFPLIGAYFNLDFFIIGHGRGLGISHTGLGRNFPLGFGFGITFLEGVGSLNLWGAKVGQFWFPFLAGGQTSFSFGKEEGFKGFFITFPFLVHFSFLYRNSLRFNHNLKFLWTGSPLLRFQGPLRAHYSLGKFSYFKPWPTLFH